MRLRPFALLTAGHNIEAAPPADLTAESEAIWETEEGMAAGSENSAIKSPMPFQARTPFERQRTCETPPHPA